MIKALLFDFDGTVVDTNKLVLDSFRYALNEKNNLGIPDSEIVKLFGEPLEKSLAKLGVENVEDVIKLYRSYNDSHHDDLIKDIPGVKEALARFKEMDIKLAVVTSKRKIILDRGVKLLGLDKYFDVLVSPEDTEKHKPEAEPVLKACELLNIDPKDAIMVGDSHNDILAGNNAGVRTALVSFTVLDLEETIKVSNPTYVIDTLLELLDK